MKLFIVTSLLALISLAFATDAQNRYIVSYPDETPDWIVDQAKTSIRAAVGFII